MYRRYLCNCRNIWWSRSVCDRYEGDRWFVWWRMREQSLSDWYISGCMLTPTILIMRVPSILILLYLQNTHRNPLQLTIKQRYSHSHSHPHWDAHLLASHQYQILRRDISLRGNNISLSLQFQRGLISKESNFSNPKYAPIVESRSRVRRRIREEVRWW